MSCRRVCSAQPDFFSVASAEAEEDHGEDGEEQDDDRDEGDFEGGGHLAGPWAAILDASRSGASIRVIARAAGISPPRAANHPRAVSAREDTHAREDHSP